MSAPPWLHTGKELNARRSPKQVEAAASTSAPAAPSGGSGRGEKFRAIKAREAAALAAKQVRLGCWLVLAMGRVGRARGLLWWQLLGLRRVAH